MGILFKSMLYQIRHQRRRHSSTFVRFDQELLKRRKEASKSMLIQVSGPDSAAEVKSYLTSEFGPIDAIFHYTLPGQVKRIATSAVSSIEFHWVIAEFNQKSDFDNAIQSCRFQEGTVPYKSSTCWFSQKLTKNESKSSKSKESIHSEKIGYPKPVINFSNAKTLNGQIELIEQTHKITELGTRLRFLISGHLEESIKPMFPIGCIIPFGSSVNGIGHQSGDLDLVLIPDQTEIFPELNQSASSNSRLWFQCKNQNSGSSSNARYQSQRVMEALADTLTLFVPGFSQIQRILNARVPILRFWSDYSRMQCDLSMTNASGVYMSELIYLMGCLDKRFPILLFAIRTWAAARKITSPTPGKQPTNFMFVLLLLYFLQHKKILPTLDILFNNARKTDKRTTADGIDCTFIRDMSEIKKYFTPQNQESTQAELLFEFFQFYAEFDFSTKGVSLFTGSAWGKPDSGALYLQNPLERHLNVARNVSKEEVSRLKNECRTALWKLETSYAEGQEITLTELLFKPSETRPLARLEMREILKE